MKKFWLLLLALAIGCGSVFAFDIMSYPPPVKGGNLMVDAGLGLGIRNYEGGKMKIPPLFAQVDYALPNIPITLGGYISYYQYVWETGLLTDDYTYTWNYVPILFRANWHWGLDVKWLDLYSGLNLGYIVFWDNVEYPSGSTKPRAYDYSGFDWGLTVAGARFYFSDKIGAMAELGYPNFKIGVTFKF